ncbi:putative aspartyl protease [Trifolium repens]|nr:putative aspartyl protease [Trifolium repens]
MVTPLTSILRHHHKPRQNQELTVIVNYTIDSGSIFIFMEKEVFDLVAKEFQKQLVNFTRAKEVEATSGLSLCFDFTGVKTVPFPEVVFNLKGVRK